MNWKSIERFNGRFDVSDTGLVRNAVRGNILKLNLLSDYLGVVVKPDGRAGKSYAIKVHREVAEYFVPNPEGKKYVNHIDGNKTNNNASNLEWVTSSENTLHAYNTGLKQKMIGEDASSAVLTEDLIAQIAREYVPRCRINGLRALGRKYGFSHNTMSQALTGVYWKHLKADPLPTIL